MHMERKVLYVVMGITTSVLITLIPQMKRSKGVRRKIAPAKTIKRCLRSVNAGVRNGKVVEQKLV
jgi:hypothetical protein